MELVRAVSLVVGIGALFAGGCAQGAALEMAEPIPEVAEQTPGETEGDPDSDTTEDAADLGNQSAPLQLQSCGLDQQGKIEAVIQLQTDLFSAGDFEQAHLLATDSFQRSVPVAAFADLIVRDYPALVLATDLSFRDCVIDKDRMVASIEVNVLTSENQVFRLNYVMVQQPDSWRIDGASDLVEVGIGA